MVDPVRALAVGGTIGALVAGTLVAPQFMGAMAEEPVKAVASAIEDMFPPATVDPRLFRKFDIVFDDSISTDVQRTQVVHKIGYGRPSEVTIVTTPSGTYSTDGLLSPHVQYPGIEVKTKSWNERSWHARRVDDAGHWSSFSDGSFTYFTYRAATRT